MADEPSPYPIPEVTTLRAFAEALVRAALVQIADDRRPPNDEQFQA